MFRLIKSVLNDMDLKEVMEDSNVLKDSISDGMFSNEDVETIEICNNRFFVVKLKGINGTIPASFFTDKAKDKLRNLARVRDSELWKVLNDPK